MMTEDIERRADAIFTEDLAKVQANTDRSFTVLLVLQWFLGIVVALFVSPRSWYGVVDQTHPHVWAAILLGGTITSLPVCLAWWRSGHPVTRHVVAASQMLWSTLLIHLTGGRIETHFHIFGSLALLAFYRDWRVLMTATTIVAVDHIIRGFFWPFSVYGVLSGQEWRWVEHAGWVCFEVVFLLVGNHHNLRQMARSALQKAQLEERQMVTEIEVQNRTRELEAANLELRQARREAEDASAAKSQFLANMSHEIRTPMTAIIGFAETIADNVQKPENIDAVETIRRNADHLLTVINDILDLSKIEAGKFALEKLPCSPQEVLREVHKLMQERADRKGLNWQTRVEGPLPRVIETDVTRLRQILINLAGNAIKFTETGGVQLVARSIHIEKQLFLAFDVIDSGIGLTEEQRTCLFQPFTQADVSMSRKFGGTGLGLTISKHFAEMLGGDISVDSTPRKGSRFTLTVAAGAVDGNEMVETEPRLPAEEAGPRNAPRAVLAGKSILLLEDGPDNQRLIAFVLRKAGALVTIADNGRIGRDMALEAAGQGHPFDVVLTDMQMPVMDGYTATRELRAAGYEGPIIALTAHAMAEDRQKCLAAGCDGFTTKPIDRTALVDLVKRHASQGRDVSEHASTGR